MSRLARRSRARGVLVAVAAIAILSKVGCEPPPPEPTAMLPPWPAAAADDAAVSLAAVLDATNVYVVLDASGSMREEGCSEGRAKIDAAKQALVEFAGGLESGVNLGLLAFDGTGVSERLPLAPAQRDAFLAALGEIRPAARTPLGSAIEQGYDALLAQGRRQLGYGDYHLVVVTDGRASDGEDPTAVVDRILGESPVVLHTIGFCIDDDHSLNQPGRVPYRTARSTAELREGLDAVLAESPDFAVTEF